MRKTNLIVLLAFVLVLCLAFAACAPKEKAKNSISGLADITATCGDAVPKLNATAEYGEVAYGLAKAAEGAAKESLTYGEYTGTLTHGTYYVKATVAESEDYKSAEAYAKITVNHQAFDKIAGNGETKHETTAEGKYRVWTEKKCACGETIVGNETVTDKLPATISGIADIDNAKCGYVVATDGITSDKGTLTFAIATATEGTSKEDLTYSELGTTPLTTGVYYLKASVAEGEDFAAATAYAKITVTHKTFEEIGGDATFVDPVFDAQTNGYYKKQCACGQDIKGSVEFVAVRVTVNGTALIDQVVEIGGKLVVPTDLPQAREGYAIVFSDAQGQQFDFTAHTVNNFETIALSAKEYATEVRNGKYSNKNSGAWMFTVDETGLTEENVSIFTQKDGYVEIQTNFLPKNDTASLQLSLGSAVVDVYHTYKFTFKATQGTFVWFGDNFENAKFTYTDEMAAANTVVEVVMTCSDGNLIGNFNGQELNFGKLSNLNATILHFQDKDEKLFANRGKRYTITVTDMVATYDYMTEAQTVLAKIPADVADVTVDNAFSLDETIKLFDAIANKHFSANERIDVAVNAEVRAKVAEIVSNPLVYLNNIIKDLPDFDNGKAITPSNEEQLYQIIVDYVGYAKTMLTAEQLKTYSEPENVSLYRYYFFKNRDSAVVDVLNKVGVTGGDISANKIVMNNGGAMTLPAINFDLYQDITLAILVNPSSGQAVSSVTYNGKTASATTKIGSNWAQFHARKVDGVWYAQMSAPQSFDKSKAVELPADVISGKKGVEINFACDQGATIEIGFSVAYGAFSDGTQKAVANVMVGKLVQPDVNVYVVNYSYKTASGADDRIIHYYIEGKQLTLPQVPAEYVNHHTYQFDGWFAGEKEYNGGETVSADLEITAAYSVKAYETHTIYFYLSDDAAEPYATKTINYGDKLVLPAAPTKTDPTGAKRYTFVGWKTVGGTYVTAETIVEDDMELTAEFMELKPVTITYTNLEGGDIVDNTKFTGEKLVRPEDPTREGFAFMGWYTTAGEAYDFDSILEINELTLVAKWYKSVNDYNTVVTAEEMLAGTTFTKFCGGADAPKVVDASTRFSTWGFTFNGVDKYSKLVQAKTDKADVRTVKLPAVNYNMYSNMNFAISSYNILGVTIDSKYYSVLEAGNGEQSHWVFVINNGKMDIYAMNTWSSKLVADIPLSDEVLNGKEGLEISMNISADWVTWFISEMKGTLTYVDYVAQANALDAELVEWCKTNAANVAEMTAEQKATFATKLNELYIARNGMTSYEASKNKISDEITYVQNELANLDDVYFDMFSAASDLKYDALFRDASRDKVGQAVKNSAYKAFNQATALDYFGFVTDGTNTSKVSFTLPAINFEALNMTFSFNFARQNTSAETLVTLNGIENSNKYNTVGNNLEWCYVMSIYKDATKGWIARWHTDRGENDYMVQLTEAQVNGSESLTFNVTLASAAWFDFYISNISATF